MTTHQLHTRHERLFESNRFVYPVLSRRSGGISIGVNLNPDKICNFDCVYCQVNRTEQSDTRFVETEQLLDELDDVLRQVTSGRLYETEKFQSVPESLRRLNDIAFSGDGEPTTFQNFDEIIAACAELKRRRKLNDVKMVLITNASMFHRPNVARGLNILDENQGEIWAKLDAGTEAYFQLVARTPIRFRQILNNITQAAQRRPLVIQSMFMRIDDKPPSSDELDAYCNRLLEVTKAGGKLSSVQIYTVARTPTEGFVTPLANAEVDHIAELVQRQTGLQVASYYGSSN